MKKNTKSALLLSVVSIIVCCTMLLGTTMAWFTDSVTSAKNQIIAGNLDIVLEMFVDGEWIDAEDEIIPFVAADGRSQEEILWEPGCTYNMAPVRVRNVGNLSAYVVIGIRGVDGDAKLLEAIEFTTYLEELEAVNEKALEGSNYNADGKSEVKPITGTPDGTVLWDEFLTPKGEIAPNNGLNDASASIILSGHMSEEAGNEYKGLSIEGITITVVATQAVYEEDSFNKYYDLKAELPKLELPADTWDGTVDISWYTDNPDATEYSLSTAEQLAGLAALVDAQGVSTLGIENEITLPVTFEGKTIKLTSDVDLYAVDENGERISFDPIGDDYAFEGTFDGQDHTIANLYQSGWDFGYEWGSYGSVGLFGELKNATVKNVTISGAESLVEGGDVGGITGSATGTCVFENITLEDSVFATYNNGNGGIIGWSGAGDYTFKNITIGEDVVLAGLWGSFDSSIGGIVGQGEPGATYNFENVDIACRLDVYNDCTASYDYYNYRMCGMIIGRLAKTTTIDGTNYPDMSQYNITCTNVTVTYGEWANYHYCEPTPGYNNGRGMRVEPGYAYDGLPADYDHSQCVDNHMNLIPFDQIFGGAQLGVKGLPAYDGVTVIYNNK